MYVIDRSTNSVVFIPVSTAVVSKKDARSTAKKVLATLNEVDRQH